MNWLKEAYSIMMYYVYIEVVKNSRHQMPSAVRFLGLCFFQAFQVHLQISVGQAPKIMAAEDRIGLLEWDGEHGSMGDYPGAHAVLKGRTVGPLDHGASSSGGKSSHEIMYIWLDLVYDIFRNHVYYHS